MVLSVDDLAGMSGLSPATPHPRCGRSARCHPRPDEEPRLARRGGWQAHRPGPQCLLPLAHNLSPPRPLPAMGKSAWRIRKMTLAVTAGPPAAPALRYKPYRKGLCNVERRGMWLTRVHARYKPNNL